MNSKPPKNLSSFFLSASFSGYLPKMPGTYGSLVALVIAYIIMYDGGFTETPWINSLILIMLSIVFTISSIPLINTIETQSKIHDPSWIVIDEVVGLFISICWYPIWYVWWLPILGFALFRFFDIAKPWPISLANDRTGGFYVMLDDILAGSATLFILVGIIYLLRFYEIFGLIW